MALTSSRSGQVRGRPVVDGGGSSGSRTAHSASVRSLAKRSPSRVCCARVIAVHIRLPIQLGHDGTLDTYGTLTAEPHLYLRLKGRLLLDDPPS